jgi:hypothetical protein
MRWWKVLGLAGFAGVTATGVVIARAERSRRAATPEEIKEQLHARLAEVSAAGAAPGGAGHTGPGQPGAVAADPAQPPER